MDVRELLEQVKSGAVGIEDAEKALKDLPIWGMQSWTITENSGPDSVRPCSARESRMHT